MAYDLLSKMPLQFEPNKVNRFILRFPADLGIQEWTVVSATRPSLTINQVEIPFLNTSTYVAGRYSWENIQVVLNDPIGPSSTQAVMEWNRLIAESLTGRMGYAAGYKRNVELEMLDPTGVVSQKWILVNAFPLGYKGGELNYGQDGLAQVTFDLRMDYCICAY